MIRAFPKRPQETFVSKGLGIEQHVVHSQNTLKHDVAGYCYAQPMSEQKTALAVTGSHALAAPVFVLPGLSLPPQVVEFLRGIIAECNRRISLQLSTFPNAHEEALDLMFISHFASMQGAIKFGSHWTVRIDAHFIGGGRHYQTWEVADIGLMAIFRRGGKIHRSKLTFLQSKKLYASPLKVQEFDPYHRRGIGRLLVTEEEHSELVQPKLLKYSETSRYKAMQLGSEQQQAMHEFSTRYGIGILYLLYNPSLIPWQIQTPVEQVPSIPENKIGARVLPKKLVDNMTGKQAGYSPSYADISKAFAKEFTKSPDTGGWRMEGFICDHFITGTVGLVDDSPNFQTMTRLLSQKSSPISSALSITFDYEE